MARQEPAYEAAVNGPAMSDLTKVAALSSNFTVHNDILGQFSLQIASLEEKWSQIETGQAYANEKRELSNAGLKNEYLARVTKFYSEGNSVIPYPS